jgi:hypothetical protein
MKHHSILSGVFRILAVTVTVAGLSMSANAGTAGKETPAVETKSGLSGIELWTIHCNRCHTYRGSNEFTAAHWGNILLHMRVRANLPAAQAREILKYLQQGAGK